MIFRKDIPGWLHDSEISTVERLCNLIPEGKDVLEIGPFAGRTTQIFAQLCESRIIYSIDPWPIMEPPQVWTGMVCYDGPDFNTNDTKKIFHSEIVDKFSNVIPIHGRFPEDYPTEYTTNLGLVHWDTDNVTAVEDIDNELHAAWNILPVGGILSGHTFAYWMSNVVQAVRHFAIEKNVDVILPPSGSMWYMVKP
jgi:hypothetical protein